MTKKQSHKLSVQIKPNAKENKIMGWQNGYLKIAIKAPPVDGKANKALINFLANYCDIPKSSIQIIHGETSSIKHIEIASTSSLVLELIGKKP